MPHRNLAVELLQKLLKGELALRRRKNVVQARSFAEMLEQTIRRYQNRSIEAAKVIARVFSLKVRQEAGDERWYVPYVEMMVTLHAVPSTINTSSQRALARPITRAEMAQMIYLVQQTQRNQ
jgi:CRP-like cAMP-binding protein